MRLPPPLHAALKRRAREEGVSLNGLCLAALKGFAGMGAQESSVGTRVPLDGIKSLLGASLSGVVLFGSADIDLLIVVNTELPLTRSLYERWDREVDPPGASRISPHFVHLPGSAERAGSLWYEAAVEGIVLLDPEGVVSRFLRTLRRSMAEGTLLRKSAYGHPYWVKRGGEVAHVQ